MHTKYADMIIRDVKVEGLGEPYEYILNELNKLDLVINFSMDNYVEDNLIEVHLKLYIAGINTLCYDFAVLDGKIKPYPPFWGKDDISKEELAERIKADVIKVLKGTYYHLGGILRKLGEFKNEL